jgi:flagellar hook assembly protein FlgD
VATVVDREFPAGRHNVAWDGADSAGRHVPAGIYFYRIEAGANASTKKMIVLR